MTFAITLTGQKRLSIKTSAYLFGPKRKADLQHSTDKHMIFLMKKLTRLSNTPHEMDLDLMSELLTGFRDTSRKQRQSPMKINAAIRCIEKEKY